MIEKPPASSGWVSGTSSHRSGNHFDQIFDENRIASLSDERSHAKSTPGELRSAVKVKFKKKIKLAVGLRDLPV